MAARLIGDLHYELLAATSAAAGVHFQGLQQAGRFFQKSLNAQQRRRLVNLDIAFQVSRHITEPFAKQFVMDIVGAVGRRETIMTEA